LRPSAPYCTFAEQPLAESQSREIAIEKQALPPGGYAEMITSTTLLNRIGPELA
jgi:hypothetical protein